MIRNANTFSCFLKIQQRKSPTWRDSHCIVPEEGFNIKMLSYQYRDSHYKDKIDGLMQERRNSSALAMQSRFSCAKPSRWSHDNLFFIMGIPIPGKKVFILKWSPDCYSYLAWTLAGLWITLGAGLCGAPGITGTKVRGTWKNRFKTLSLMMRFLSDVMWTYWKENWINGLTS